MSRIPSLPKPCPENVGKLPMLSRKRVPRADWSDGWTHRSAVSPHSLNHLRKEPYVSQQWEKSPRVEECLSTHNDIHTTGKICDRGKPFSNVFHLRWQNMTQPRENVIHGGKAFGKDLSLETTIQCTLEGSLMSVGKPSGMVFP